MRRSLVQFVTISITVACSPVSIGVPRDTDAPIQTDRSQYVAKRVSQGVEFTIPFTFTNTTSETVFLPNCRVSGKIDLDMILQKQVDGGWRTVWSPITRLCLSPPVLIAPQETYVDTLRGFGGRPGEPVAPELQVQEVEGVYRLVWTQLRGGFRPERYPQGDTLPLALKVSNAFELKY